MKKTFLFRNIRNTVMAASLILVVAIFSSCDSLHEDLQPCPEGLRLRFVYDYNMEFANAFHSQVDCLTVLFFDQEGKHVSTVTAEGDELSDENWRMTVDLAPGEYNILAYGGLGCEESDFSFTGHPSDKGHTGMQVKLKEECLGATEGENLHHLFYGSLKTVVENGTTSYTEATVKMMKNTNNLRIILQQVDGQSLDHEDFDFSITDDNMLYGHDNDIIPFRQAAYLPWARGNASPGTGTDGTDASVAYAEMSFPRLVTGNAPRLLITRRSDGEKVVDIPLNNYLLLLKSQQFAGMGNQEFLDRESRWNMIFLLDRNLNWLKTQLIINDWVVRINNTDLWGPDK